MSLVGPDQISSAQKEREKKVSNACCQGGCNITVWGVQEKEGSRGGVQPGQHSASACSPQPSGRTIERLTDVKLSLKQPS